MYAEDKTIVFIHGLWMTARCWEHWVERYNRGRLSGGSIKAGLV